ncbi:beta-glucosidase [Arthrobacter sp. cf158]|uniref:beta-glucosidase family protein n=1 Tax=Arthrobacter sp. cf158 TaxID=1761744 RepID=UPI00089787CD|nr:glycoside hydrolase family 3 C-terminal domain-containing protein [Arthrobacter sp. cf158]SDW88846.1 beta-glucosidase [Arthrobacter sp. cf158]
MTDVIPQASIARSDPSSSGVSHARAAALTTGADYWTTKEVPDIGLRSLRFADGPHGLRVQNDENPDHLGLERSAPATCFPPAVTLASSWDPALVEAIGAALGHEARAAGVDVVLGPGLNIKRSPLCGRNFEYYSEDPLLAGSLAAAAVRGLQSQNVAACLKHFAVNNQETDRLRISAEVDERTLREVYLRAFQVALRESQPWSMMSSYNRINGVYASENRWLLTDLLRGEWGYDGVVVSDWGAVHDPVAAVNAGLELRMPGRPEDARVSGALKNGLIPPVVLERSAERLLRLAARTTQDSPNLALDHDAHHELVRHAAAESAVLLTNDGTLPLDVSTPRRVAIIGELARTPRYQGAGSSRVNASRVVSALDALTGRLESGGWVVDFVPGYHLDAGAASAELVQEAVNAARGADVVLLFLGLPGAYESEGVDRTSIDLPEDQLELLRSLGPMDVPKIASLSNGAVVTTAAWRSSVNAIVEFWLTGQAHGDSIADVLLGDAEPGGRLAETIPVRLEDTASFLSFPGEAGEVVYGEGIHVGYRYHDARDLAVDYPFGHGLSYTTFSYADLAVSVRPLEDPVAFEVEALVTNTGIRSGSEVVQVYVTDHCCGVQTPPRELRGWKKIKLDGGASDVVRIPVRRADLEHWHSGVGGWAYEGGLATVHIGSSSRDLKLAADVALPGKAIVVPLNQWSTFGDFMDHAVIGPQLRALAESRGGFRGRIGDLLGEEAGRANVLAMPLATIVEFPGIPLEPGDLQDFISRQNQ